MVNPFAQYIVTQAMLNVVGRGHGRSRCYDTVPDEARFYLPGGYGELQARSIAISTTNFAGRGAEWSGALVPPALDRIRRTRGPFKSDDDLLLAASYDDSHYRALKKAGPIDTSYPPLETPLYTLMKGLAARPAIKSFQLRQA